MSGNVKEVVLTKEIVGAIARSAADIVETQLALDDRLEIDPDQLNKLADKISTRLDAKVDYDQIKKNTGFNDLSRRISDLKRELTDQDRLDIAEQVLTELDLSEEIKSTLARSFVSKSFFNQKIGGLMQLARDNKGRAGTAGISGKEMIEEINKILGTDWQDGGAGGDMLKSVYDTNDDGKVNEADVADSVPWDGVTDKPAIGDMLKSAYDTNNDGKVNAADAADSVPWTGVTAVPISIDPSGNVTGMGRTEQIGIQYIKAGEWIKFTLDGTSSGSERGWIGINSAGIYHLVVGLPITGVISASKAWFIIELTGESTSPTTGAQRVKGGIGVAKNAHIGGNTFLHTVKAGATQAAAGAAANEIWQTSGHATLPDNVLMRGI